MDCHGKAAAIGQSTLGQHVAADTLEVVVAAVEGREVRVAVHAASRRAGLGRAVPLGAFTQAEIAKSTTEQRKAIKLSSPCVTILLDALVLRVALAAMVTRTLLRQHTLLEQRVENVAVFALAAGSTYRSRRGNVLMHVLACQRLRGLAGCENLVALRRAFL